MKKSRSQILPNLPQFDRRASIHPEDAKLKQFLLSTHKNGAACDCDLCNALGQLFILK